MTAAVLRARLDAAEALVRAAKGSYLFGGAWNPGVVSVRDLAAALGIEPNEPPAPPSDEDMADIRQRIAEIRA